MDIQVNDAKALLEQAANIGQLAQNILRVNEDLAAAKNQISGAWASDTEDKESYFKVINENINKVNTLCAALRSLSNNLTAYAQKQIQNANSAGN